MAIYVCSMKLLFILKLASLGYNRGQLFLDCWPNSMASKRSVFLEKNMYTMSLTIILCCAVLSTNWKLYMKTSSFLRSFDNIFQLFLLIIFLYTKTHLKMKKPFKYTAPIFSTCCLVCTRKRAKYKLFVYGSR